MNRYIAIALCVLIVESAAFRIQPTYSEEDYCPPSDQCFGCNLEWGAPTLTEEDNYISPDRCSVTFSWNWRFNSSFTGPNPRGVFNCLYENGDSCNIGNEEVCASCKSITLVGLQPSRNPVVAYSDTCGNHQNFRVAENCFPPTEAPTEPPTETPTEPETELPTEPETELPTEPPTEPQETTIVEETTFFETSTEFEETTTEFVYSTPEAETTNFETSTVPGAETTEDADYCPSVNHCNECPDSWEEPVIYDEGLLVGNDSCDVTLYWDSSLSSTEGGPRMRFTCVYAENGEYCKPLVDLVCASCESITLEGLQPSLNPIIQYADSCGITDEFSVGGDCVIPETTYLPEETTTDLPDTTSPPEYGCPSYEECEGCPADFGIPDLSIAGSPLVNNTCDITISWSWNYSPIDNVENPRLTFQCLYEPSGFCPGGTQAACGSCEQVVFENVREDKDPYINYSDTCGNLFRLNIGDICK